MDEQKVLSEDKANTRDDVVEQKRRAALKRLGLAVGVAYAAPTLLKLDRSALAMGISCISKPNNPNCR